MAFPCSLYSSYNTLQKYHIKKNSCVYLTASDLSCGKQGVYLWHLGSVLVAHGLRCSAACGILAPQLGIEPVSSAVGGRFSTTREVPTPPCLFSLDSSTSVQCATTGLNPLLWVSVEGGWCPSGPRPFLGRRDCEKQRPRQDSMCLIVLREDSCERENGAIDHGACLTRSEGEREVWRDCCRDSSRELPLRGALGVCEPTFVPLPRVVVGWELGSVQKVGEESRPSSAAALSHLSHELELQQELFFSQSSQVLSMESYPGLGCVP